MGLPPKLAREIGELKDLFMIEVQEDPSFVNLIFKSFPVGPGFNATSADLLIRIPLSYPDAGPDMFWTDPVLTLDNGCIPQAADSIETYIGRQWRRFSWHHNRWNSLTDNLHSYIEFVRNRLKQKH